MERISLDRGWMRAKESPALFFPMQGRMGNPAVEVNLPDDCNIDEAVTPDCPDGGQVGFFQGNRAVYTKELDIPADWEGKSVYLELDGSYCNTEITLDGSLIAMHPNGYAPFTCDLSDYINYGEKNRLAVFVNNSMGYTARWYSGTGIYRHVDLRVAPKVHLAVNPVFVTTEKIVTSENGSYTAVLHVQVEVENESNCNKDLRAEVQLFEDKGHHVPHDPNVIASGAAAVSAAADSTNNTAHIKLTLENAKLWDLDSPNLYIAEVKLYEKDELLDFDSTLCGIRTIAFDAENGLRLNGKTVKIKGGCMHHDNGILGAASFYDSEYRRLAYHKANGFNGIRCAHNPMSRDMMEASDRLGLLVYAEAFDVWRMSKNINDYHLFFEDWWDRDLTAFIKRDRNHPSVFCWSIGNEIVERNGLKGGAKYARLLSKRTRELDPSRPVSAAVPTMFNGMNDKDTLSQLQSMMAKGGPGQNLSTPFSQEVWADRTNDFCEPLDIAGYNYLDMRYEMDHEIYPNRVICGTESYPTHIAEVWDLVEKLPYVIGDFTWTSQDYLGETGCGKIVYRAPEEEAVPRQVLQADQFPSRTANCSDFDITGKDMPALHYRKAVWGSDETYIAVMKPQNYGKTAYRTAWAWDDCSNTWHFPGEEGKRVEVEVYSRAEEVELLINGVVQGRAAAGKANDYKAKFDVIYEAGEIEAVSYTGGKEISRQKLATPEAACKIQLTPEKETVLAADGQSLLYIHVEIVDKNGNVVPNVSEKLTAVIEPGEISAAAEAAAEKAAAANGSAAAIAQLAAFGSAAPVTEELYTAGSFTSYKGHALAIVRSGYESGKVKLTVNSENYGSASLAIEIHREEKQ